MPSKYKERALAGLCPSCGKCPPVVQRKLCEPCLEARREVGRKHKLSPAYAIRLQKHHEWADEHKDEISAKQRAKYQYNKKRAFDLLGGVCACCGEPDIRFLTIDHINGDGAEHRRTVSKYRSGGWGLYSWIMRDKPLTEGMALQLLCFNCNCAKKDGPCCPHQISTAHPDQLNLFS